MNPVTTKPANCPIILAFPHSGTWLPPDIQARLNDVGNHLQDTDWHVGKLYDDLLPDAGIVKANFHRYVIDANRDPADVSLYPGQNTTGLCPLINFDGAPIWQENMQPNKADIAARIRAYHQPYHQALRAMLDDARAQYGFAILYDCHSIRADIPFLFEGVLPALNIGTFNGKSCAESIEKMALDSCAISGFSHVLNGRFKGGWTTRHYGDPQNNIHAIQMEIAQSAYMLSQAPWDYLPDQAKGLRAVLKTLLSRLNTLQL
jgi:formiminoglutamase